MLLQLINKSYFSFFALKKLIIPPRLINNTEIHIQSINGFTWYLILKYSLPLTVFITKKLSFNNVVLMSASLVTIIGWL